MIGACARVLSKRRADEFMARTQDTTAVARLLGQIDSLNLSATAAVLFYEALRQRSGRSA